MVAKHALLTRAPARAGRHAGQPRWVAPEHRLRQPAMPYARGAGTARLTRGQRWLRRSRTMLATAAVISGASLLGVLGGSGTFALWSGSTTVTGSSIGSSEAALVASPETLSTANMLPGEVRVQSFLLTNQGDVSLDVTPTVATTFTDYELRVLIVGTGTTCTAALLAGYDAVGTTPDTNPDPGQRVQVAVVAPGQMQVCTSITARSTVQPEESQTFALTLDGVQHQ
jgi:hypothetical protein